MELAEPPKFFDDTPTFIYNLGTGKEVPLDVQHFFNCDSDFYIKYRKDKIVEFESLSNYSNYSPAVWNGFLKIIKNDKLDPPELDTILTMVSIPQNCQRNLISAIKEDKIKEIE